MGVAPCAAVIHLLTGVKRPHACAVAMRDEVEYFREVGLLQEIKVTAVLAGLSIDGSRWLLRHEILSTDGKLCARVTSAGGWMDLAARKLIAPPGAILTAMNSLDRTNDFVQLPSSLKVLTTSN